MMDDRLPARLEASSLVRRAEAEGGFGMIIARGDPDRGALVLLIAQPRRARRLPRARA